MVYFVSFFFLFLFTFLFFGIIVKRVRALIAYNRLQQEYLKARASRVVPPLFAVQLLDSTGKLRVLSPSSSPVVLSFSSFPAFPFFACLLFWRQFHLGLVST